MAVLFHEAQGFTFIWDGAYIEIYESDSTTPFDAYNVWDYEAAAPRIATTQAGLVAYVEDRIREEGLPEVPPT